MDDPIRRHPTRGEQLDILSTLIVDHAKGNDNLLDLGCGVGYVCNLLLSRIHDLQVVGIDSSTDSLTTAKVNLAKFSCRLKLFQGDLENVDAIKLPDNQYRFIMSILTFHELTNGAKRRVIEWVSNHLEEDGLFFLYDRIKLDQPSLFSLQKSIWKRVEREYGTAMKTAENYSEYRNSFSDSTPPATLNEYSKWFFNAGLSAACVHLHGNVALIAGKKVQ